MLRALTQQAFDHSDATCWEGMPGEGPVGGFLSLSRSPVLISEAPIADLHPHPCPSSLGSPQDVLQGPQLHTSEIITVRPTALAPEPLPSPILPRGPELEHRQPQGLLHLLFPLTSSWSLSPVDARA